MAEEKEFDELQGHKKFAVNLFNKTWELMDKKERTKAEDDEMIHAAHASRFHWGGVVAAGTPNTGPMNIERGEWQLSRVYSIIERAEPALYHAKRCLDICEKNDIGDFDIAFAYEALARAHSIAGNRAEFEKYLQLAKDASTRIKKDDDRDYFLGDLKTVPGYK